MINKFHAHLEILSRKGQVNVPMWVGDTKHMGEGRDDQHAASLTNIQLIIGRAYAAPMAMGIQLSKYYRNVTCCWFRMRTFAANDSPFFSEFRCLNIVWGKREHSTYNSSICIRL